jgi:gas vesicle protein
MRNVCCFLAGAVVGGAAGLIAGLFMAPRPGIETRSMVADEASQAWDGVVGTYQKGTHEVVEKASAAVSEVGAKSDELREKIDAARVRVEQLKVNLEQELGGLGADGAEPAVEPPVSGATA